MKLKLSELFKQNHLESYSKRVQLMEEALNAAQLYITGEALPKEHVLEMIKKALIETELTDESMNSTRPKIAPWDRFSFLKDKLV